MFNLVAYILLWILVIQERKESVSDKITYEVTCCVHPSFLQALLNVKNFRGGRRGDLA